MLYCIKCNTTNTEGSIVCINCGAEIEKTTDFIQFEFKPRQVIEGRYEVIQEVGRGSMGVVYKALDKKLDRYVALKTIKFEQKKPVKIDQIRNRMILEAKAAAKLEHPNIVVVHDVTEKEKFLIHITMEYIDGIPLTDLKVPGGFKNFNTIIDIMIQICDAMSYAHEKGIIHRDLKPSNILLLRKKDVKITDFGIARIIRDSLSKLQDRGFIMGTPFYMAPERFEGVNEDPRSDIYAIGIILYELLTGEEPFKSKTREGLIEKILNSDYIHLDKQKPELPQFFEEIVSKSLDRNPHKRYQNSSDLKTELLDNFKNFVKKSKELKKHSIWNVPFYRNINFTGREEILDNIRKELISGEAGSNILVIIGLGGVGKTQIALEYSIRQSKNYSIVWWIRAEEPSTIASEFASLAQKLDLPVKYLEQSKIVENVKLWLQENGGWLLVFDNADKSEDINEFIPKSISGHVLITSRNPKWGGLAKKIAITKWKPEESLDFIFKRTKDDDEVSAIELANKLGNLPLALEQAAAYIEGSGRSLSEYLNMFNKYQQRLLSRGKPLNYPKTVATTWEMSFQKLRKEFPESIELLNLISFFAPDDIPLKIISEKAEHLPESLATVVSDPIEFDDAISAIRSYSLINRTGDLISVHRLVQAAARDRMKDEERKKWIGIAVRILNDSFSYDEDDVGSWDVCKSLVSHALAATLHSEVN
ncbi:protein kinase, partial [bacterium]|nr:protein kinase [bacterium]